MNLTAPPVTELDLTEEPATLEDYARLYREYDAQEKAAKKAKEDLRGPFFALMSQKVREEVELEQEVIEVPAEDVERFNNDPREFALFYYPTYTVENIAYDGSVWKLVLKENPELKPIDLEVDGFKLGRSISLVGAEFKAEDFYEHVSQLELDDEIEEDLADELYEVVDKVYVPQWEYRFDEGKAREMIASYPELLPLFQRFSYAGKPQVKFLPVTKAKTEEEDSGGTD